MAERPTSNNDRAGWKEYWAGLGMPWRTDPEIEESRQSYLAVRQTIVPNIERGDYPCRDENGGIRLTRADVEWLLATLTSGGARGPIDWSDDSQHSREGLDLRGAQLQSVDLSNLPIARMMGGIPHNLWNSATQEQREWAAVHLEGANLQNTSMQGAHLGRAHLENTDLSNAHLEQAHLVWGHLEGANLTAAHLEGANLRAAYFSDVGYLDGIRLTSEQYGSVKLSGVRWKGADLTVIDWTQLIQLGDESDLRVPIPRSIHGARRKERLRRIERAVRANRQLATSLRAQGLSEDADRFAYRAQHLQRQVLQHQGKLGRAFGSALLDLVAGYGYKPVRSVLTYVIVVLSFAAAYFALSNFGPIPFFPSHSSPLLWYEALVLSVGSFHGRGLFPTGLSLGDPIAILAAFEAIIGLLIEITFIATFTQRFFAR